MPRRPKKFHFLYKTTCSVTKRYYFGIHSTNDLDDGYLGSGKRLRYSIRKHGEDKHTREIIEFFDSRQALLEREVAVVDFNEIAKINCMNIALGGSGGWSHVNRDREYAASEIKSRSENLRGKLLTLWSNADYRAQMIEKTKQRHRDGVYDYSVLDRSGTKHTEETKAKMRASASGKHAGSKNSQFGTCWIYNLQEKRSMKIAKTDLDIMLQAGWLRGRKMKF